MSKPKILAVDDEEFNLDLISEFLSESGFEVITAIDGLTALNKITEHDDIAVILLDRMMPVMTGIDVLKNIKKNSRYKNTPIIMQTAASDPEQIQEGLDLGVYYYLSKPFKEDLLVRIVKSAHEEHLKIKELASSGFSKSDVPNLLTRGVFTYKNLTESKNLAAFLTQCYPDPAQALASISVLLDNAIYRNLDISADDQNKLSVSGKLDTEVSERLKQDVYRSKCAQVILDVTPDKIVLKVLDQGRGFDWDGNIKISAESTYQTATMGFIRAKSFFTNLEFKDKGTEVICTTELSQAA